MLDDDELNKVLGNDLRALVQARADVERDATLTDRVTDAIAAFAGSTKFVLLHVVVVVAWIALNVGVVSWIRPFDPFPFVVLAIAASIEAIFLSTFVLLRHNRMSQRADRRAELDVRIGLLAEHELTRLLEEIERPE